MLISESATASCQIFPAFMKTLECIVWPPYPLLKFCVVEKPLESDSAGIGFNLKQQEILKFW